MSGGVEIVECGLAEESEILEENFACHKFNVN
jgi:hypothetical protein